MKDPKTYDLLSVLVGLAGIHEGLMPFLAKIFDWHPGLSFPLRLPAPAWWIVSVIAILVALTLLAVIDKAKKRRFGD